MKFALTFGMLNPSAWLEVAEVADGLGYDSVWLPEHMVLPVGNGRKPARRIRPPADPRRTSRCSTSSPTWRSWPARTSRIRFGTHVYNIGLRHPFTTARAAATLDRVSDGRLLFGIGASWMREEWDAVGLDFDSRGSAGRRGDRRLSPAVVRRGGRTPRRVLRLRPRHVRAQAGAAAHSRSTSAATARPPFGGPRRWGRAGCR